MEASCDSLDNDCDDIVDDVDVDGDKLTATLVDDATDGSLSLETDGSFTYIPGPNFNGSDSFTYEVSDAEGLTSNTATVNITVDIGLVGECW